MDEEAPSDSCGKTMEEKRPPPITFRRRQELITLANQIAETYLTRAEKHERYTVKRMVDLLIQE